MRDEILDEFQGFIEDEEHAILISSHITSDLGEDRTVSPHSPGPRGARTARTPFWSTMPLGCTQAQLRDIQPEDLVRVRKGSFGCEALVRDRAAFARKYPGLMLDLGDAGGYHA